MKFDAVLVAVASVAGWQAFDVGAMNKAPHGIQHSFQRAFGNVAAR